MSTNWSNAWKHACYCAFKYTFTEEHVCFHVISLFSAHFWPHWKSVHWEEPEQAPHWLSIHVCTCSKVCLCYSCHAVWWLLLARSYVRTCSTAWFTPPRKLGCIANIYAHTHTGAVNGQVGEDDVTHLVVADGVGPETVPVTHPRVLVVKQQWFWESIQIEASADEGLYSIKVSLCYDTWNVSCPSEHFSALCYQPGYKKQVCYL